MNDKGTGTVTLVRTCQQMYPIKLRGEIELIEDRIIVTIPESKRNTQGYNPHPEGYIQGPAVFNLPSSECMIEWHPVK